MATYWKRKEREMSPETLIMDNITKYRSFLIGLLGHVDCGKTALARQLTEIVSTSGLDAHPQSKERGITIDLGFTSFIEDDLLITLVDAPGHADLIRSVVAAGRIINGAIVVIDGREGIQVQTAEHMVILELLNITNVLFVINKIDVSSSYRVEEIETQLKRLLKLTKFGEKSPIIAVSAKTGLGIDVLKQEIINLTSNISPSQPVEKFFAFPIDHYFKKKGIGLVVTGTTQGTIKIGETLSIVPHLIKVKVKNAQVYHQNVQEVPHGYRAGIVISGIEENQLQRGDILTNQLSKYVKAELVEVNFTFSKHFQKSIRFGSQVNVTHGMITSVARFFPFYYDDKNNKMLVEEIDLSTLKRWKEEGRVLGVLVWLQQPQYLNPDELLILSNLDLPPSTLRFFGSSHISEILDPQKNPILFHIKTKEGKIKNPNYSNTSILVDGMARSKEGAQTLINQTLEFPYGKITDVFGGKGAIVAEKPTNHSCNVGDRVYLKILRSIKISKNKSYN